MDSQDSGPECLQGRAYLGIGMQYDLDGLVTVAPQSYPAYKAGIRPGDQVLNPEFEPDADGYDTVDLKHHGRHYRVHIKTQWICLR